MANRWSVIPTIEAKRVLNSQGYAQRNAISNKCAAEKNESKREAIGLCEKEYSRTSFANSSYSEIMARAECRRDAEERHDARVCALLGVPKKSEYYDWKTNFDWDLLDEDYWGGSSFRFPFNWVFLLLLLGPLFFTKTLDWIVSAAADNTP